MTKFIDHTIQQYYFKLYINVNKINAGFLISTVMRSGCCGTNFTNPNFFESKISRVIQFS